MTMVSEGPVRVSVVVPARDAAATIPATLAALAGQRTDDAYEVIVVDSGSSDATPALATAAGARLLHNPAGEPAGSRNLGVRHARGAILAFTDADCVPAPDWLAAGVRALAVADIVQGRVEPVRPPARYDRTVAVRREYGLYETANLFASRDAFSRVGGFAPVPGLSVGAGRPFGEDAWFAWRAKRAGARSTFAADAVVEHAVFDRDAAGWIAECARARHFPQLVAMIPELRGTFLCCRTFLSPSSARFDLALVALAATRRHRPWPLLAAVPYLYEVVSEARAGGSVLSGLARAAADSVTTGALVVGSVRARTVVA